MAEQKRIVAKVEALLALCDELEARQHSVRERRADLIHSALDHLATARDARDFRTHSAFVLQHSSTTLDSVPALRQTILSLAVQGRLVPQNPKDGNASEVAERLRKQKAELVKVKAIPKPADILPLHQPEAPFQLPPNWLWVRFGQLARKIEYGTSQKAFSNAGGVPTFRMNNILDGRLLNENLKYVPETCPDLPKLLLDDGDVLFNRTNSAELVGKAAVFRGESGKFTFASYLIRAALFHVVAMPEFFNMAINSLYFRQTQIEPELTQQCGQANFNGTKLANALVPLPPLAEQRRIVAKVEALLALCDELEARQSAARDLGANLLDSLIHHALKP